MTDAVNHPSHYMHPRGFELIDLIEDLPMNRGNAIKYIYRAGEKSPDTLLQDLEKAQWFIAREIQRVTRRQEDVPRV